MENVRNYLLSWKQNQKVQIDTAHGTHELQELGSGQEVLFRSPGEDEYIPGTVINRATVPCNYILEAQGKQYSKTREHLRPIQVNIPTIHINLPKPATPKSCPHKPKVLVSHIPKPNSQLKHTSHPKQYIPKPSHHPPSHIPKPTKPSTAAQSTNAPTTVEDLWHLSSINTFSSTSATPSVLRISSAPHPALTPPTTLVQNEVESPQSQYDSSAESTSEPNAPSSACSVASSTSYTLWPRFPIMYNKTALRQLQGNNRLGYPTTCPFPCQLHAAMTSQRQIHPLKLKQILHTKIRMNHWQADPGLDSSWWPGVESPSECHQPSHTWTPAEESPTCQTPDSSLINRGAMTKGATTNEKGNDNPDEATDNAIVSNHCKTFYIFTINFINFKTIYVQLVFSRFLV